VHIGDQLGFQVGAQELQATISSIRSVTWDSFEPNFFILFPPGAFPLTPRTLLTAIHLDEPQEVLLADLARGFPTVNIIDIGAILAQVRRIIDIVSLGLNLVFGFTVAAGALVLVATLSATRDARVYEAAVLKALGCDRRRLLASLNTEFLVMGALAGTVAAVAAALIGRILATRVFYIDYTPNLLLLLVSVSAAVLLVWLVSRVGMRRVLATPPALVLKEA
jgi:putative ABC transport system permease protein